MAIQHTIQGLSSITLQVLNLLSRVNPTAGKRIICQYYKRIPVRGMEKETQVRSVVAGRNGIFLVKEGEHFTSILNVTINNEIMSKVFTYNMASRNGCRL
ncbi:MAG: hypothetical protein ACP5TZ_06550 [Nitrososphaeria archaeon]